MKDKSRPCSQIGTVAMEKHGDSLVIASGRSRLGEGVLGSLYRSLYGPSVVSALAPLRS